MAKDEKIEMDKEKKEHIVGALFHIHSLAYLLGGEDVKDALNAKNEMATEAGDPLISLPEIIREKALFCLKELGEA